jgi:hypothetical protein
MKKLLFVLSLSLLACSQQPANAQIQDNVKDHNIIQLALLLDVSGSMDGLIDQAKSELWTIVNEVAKAKKQGQSTKLEIALYEYGRSSNPFNNGYIVKLLDYTSDLDTVSKVLFSLNTDGGDEYCGWVVKSALEELQWRNNDSIYRVIFIAGNEPYNQGKVYYKNSTDIARSKGIIINTIHCGDSMTGVRTFWEDGALTGKGSYFFIDHNSRQYDIPTPYDSMIGVYNDSLNDTYWAYGSSGATYKFNQLEQDNNANMMGKSVKAKRAVSKTNKVYDNKKWDAVDASKSDSTWVYKAKDEELPAQLKGKRPDEKKAILKGQDYQRGKYARRISELNILREAYIREHKPASRERTLGSALVEAIHRQAMVKGFVFE